MLLSPSDANSRSTSSTESLSPVPGSPSPAPDSEPSEDEAERDWLESPLAYKLRQSVHRRRGKLAKRRAAAAITDDRLAKKGKKWHELETPKQRAAPLTVESLESLARQMGYKVVPASPKATSDIPEEPDYADYVFKIPGPVKEVDTDTTLGSSSKRPLSSPKQVDTLLASAVASSSKTPSPKNKRARRTTNESTSESEKPVSKQAKPAPTKAFALRPPKPSKRRENKRSTVRVVRDRYAGAVPKSKHTVASKAPVHQVGASEAPVQATKAPPVSPGRARFLRRRIRRSHRPVALHRPSERKTLSGFHKVVASPDVAPMAGHEFVHVLQVTVVNRRVRNGMLARHRTRTEQEHTKRVAPPPSRRLSGSPSDEDDEVDLLLESDVEMLDNEEIEVALAQAPSKLNASRKRPPRGGDLAAERRGRRATLRQDEVAVQAERLKAFFADRAAEREAARERRDATKRAAIEWLIAEREREREAAEAVEAARVEAETAAEAEAERQAAAEMQAEAERRAQEEREAAAAEAYEQERLQLQARIRARTARLNLALHRERVPTAGFVAPGRMRAATTPIRTFHEDAAESSTAAEARVEHEIDTLAEVTEASDTEGSEDEDDTPSTPRAPRTPSPGPRPEIPMDSPPTYEFPFFPIVRPAPRAARPRILSRQRRASDPPSYVEFRERTDRSPSPPPPYNAQSDRTTLISPVFRSDSESESEDTPTPTPRARVLDSVERRMSPDTPTPAPRQAGARLGLGRPTGRPVHTLPRRTLPGYFSMGDSDENIGARASSVSSESEYVPGSDSETEEQEPAPIVRTIGRWFGFW